MLQTQFRKKVMTKFSYKFKQPYFPHFGGKNIFLKKNQLYHVQHHMDHQHHAEFQKKLMSQAQENFRMEGQEDKMTEGWAGPNS